MANTALTKEEEEVLGCLIKSRMTLPAKYAFDILAKSSDYCNRLEQIQVVDNRYVKDPAYDRVVPDVSDELIHSQTFESRIESIKERADSIARCLQMANENND